MGQVIAKNTTFLEVQMKNSEIKIFRRKKNKKNILDILQHFMS